MEAMRSLQASFENKLHALSVSLRTQSDVALRQIAVLNSTITLLSDSIVSMETSTKQAISTLTSEFNSELEALLRQPLSSSTSVSHAFKSLNPPPSSSGNTKPLNPPPGITTALNPPPSSSPGNSQIQKLPGNSYSSALQTKSSHPTANHQSHTATNQSHSSAQKSGRSRRRHRSNESSHSYKKIKVGKQPGKVAFISDSIFKFLFEDVVVENFILNQNYENNILIHRGALADVVVKNSVSHLNTLQSAGINKLIACFGTNDVIQISKTNSSPEQIAGNIAKAVNELNEITANQGIKLLYIMPGFTSYLSESGVVRVTQELETLLTQANIAFLKTPDTLRTFALDASSFDDIVEKCTSDGVHWTFPAAQFILKTALDYFGIGMTLDFTSDISPVYTVLLKHTPNCCFRCGDNSHSKPQCTAKEVSCSHCSSEAHNTKVCGFKFLPCSHCGTVGHYTGTKANCPHWIQSRQAKAKVSSMNMSS